MISKILKPELGYEFLSPNHRPWKTGFTDEQFLREGLVTRGQTHRTVKTRVHRFYYFFLIVILDVTALERQNPGQQSRRQNRVPDTLVVACCARGPVVTCGAGKTRLPLSQLPIYPRFALLYVTDLRNWHQRHFFGVELWWGWNLELYIKEKGRG